MTTPELVKFYHAQTANTDILPRKLENFSITVGDPGDTGSKGGIAITRLVDPGQYGRVTVQGRNIRTSNVEELNFNPAIWTDGITINGQSVDLSLAAADSVQTVAISRAEGIWTTKHEHEESSTVSRKRKHMGSMSAILRTNGSFVIRHSGSAAELALQTSRNLYQYLQADAVIVGSESFSIPHNTTGNIITLAAGAGDTAQTLNFLSIKAGGVRVMDHLGVEQYYGRSARSIAYLRPFPQDKNRLELVLWGADEEGLRQAARFVPIMTGVGQPDFIVLDESARWRGIEGALAMGFFDANWKVTASSVVESV